MNVRSAAALSNPSLVGPKKPDVVCLSHLRWHFVYQRPQHLLTRCAAHRRVFFFEEPVFEPGPPRLVVENPHPSVWVAVPHLPRGLSAVDCESGQRSLLAHLFETQAIQDFVLWYYTPMALGFTDHLAPQAIVYDCMDELSAFANAPRALQEREKELFKRAHVVFTGGHSLYEAKRQFHRNIHPLPSSVDVAHFARARLHDRDAEPADQKDIPHPRLGFFGVMDERLDRNLVAAIAEARPDWQLVMIGPVVKIDPAALPRKSNIHWLGMKKYDALPNYIGGWDIALLPFARNEATRFISPTKTPEYLAAGVPVVATAIRDVIRPYGELGLVRISNSINEFVDAIAECLEEDQAAREKRTAQADGLLARMSWDSTYDRVEKLLQACMSP
jgi:glycosyltransferase involved in cell wall biosynthesis